MQGQPEVLATLNSLLIDELSARNQYLAHEAVMRDAGYLAFADMIAKRGKSEAEHADELLARIYMLSGVPDMATLRDVRVGDTPVSILENDAIAEQNAVVRYSAGATLALNQGDITTFKLLSHIGEEEAAHLNEIEGFIGQINAMGIDNFLASVTGR